MLMTTLNFVTPGPDGVVKFVLDNGWTGTNQRSIPVNLHDLRHQAEKLSFDNQGFVLSKIETTVNDYGDQDQISRLWKPAVEELILWLTGGKWLVLFAGPNMRFSEVHKGATATSVSAPARPVHSDLAGNFTYNMMERQPVAEDAVRILRKRLGGAEPRRWRIFNFWQMISRPPQDCTLAICDRSSLDPADFVEGKGFFDDPGKSREEILSRDLGQADFSITFLRENPAQRWCYVSNMEPGEALVFSTFDPEAGPGRARVPHGAVDLPNAGSGAIPRNSIEIRALVTFEE
jgi:hypothetical protein